MDFFLFFPSLRYERLHFFWKVITVYYRTYDQHDKTSTSSMLRSLLWAAKREQRGQVSVGQDTNSQHTSAHSHNTPRDTTNNTMQVTAGAIKVCSGSYQSESQLSDSCYCYCASEAGLPVQQMWPSSQLHHTGLVAGRRGRLRQHCEVQPDVT